MIHIQKLGIDADFTNAYYGNQMGGLKVKEGEPWLSYTEAEDMVNYSKNKLNPLNIPLTFRALVDDSEIMFKFEGPDDSQTREIWYSINGGSWSSVYLGDSGNTSESYQFPSLNTGDIISFAGNNNNYAESSNTGDWIWSLCADVGRFEVYGNIMSLIDAEEFYYHYNLVSGNEFYFFFYQSTAIVDASNLLLPSYNVYAYSYYSMFNGCTNLVYPPKILPATTLNTDCYANMFYECTSLVKTPELPATIVSGPGCYSRMFRGCTSLVEVPDRLFRSTTTVTNSCCDQMFYGCTSLVAAPELPASVLGGSYCYSQMFKGCTNLQSAPKILPATTLRTYCYYQMFYGCTKLERAPELPAKILVEGCYQEMFRECVNLCYINCGATTNIYVNNSTTRWVYNVSSRGLFVTECPWKWPRDSIHEIPADWNCQTIMWIDEFPDYLPDYDGEEDMEEWYYDIYQPEVGDGFIYTGETFDWRGETFFLWKNINWGDENTRAGFAYSLTRVIDFNVLDEMAVEHDFLNRYDNPKCCPIYAFLSEDGDYGYCEPHCNDSGYVLSCVRR